MVLTEPERVVVGIIRDAAGRVLVARRPLSKAFGGLWEFPGGKMQAFESEAQALQRELNEELGITVTRCEPLPHFRANPPSTVSLSFWRVSDYTGQAYGREGQEIAWRPVQELTALPFLTANIPIFARLRLPSVYLISDVERLGEAAFEERLVAALERGARLLQLREPWPHARLCRYAERVRALCAPYQARCLINGDPALVQDCADGVHLSSARLWQCQKRPLPPHQLLGASCHHEADLQHAQAIGCDFAVLSPVAPTASHPGEPPLGWLRFKALAATVFLPVYALGGLSWEDGAFAQDQGAQGVALRGAVFRGP